MSLFNNWDYEGDLELLRVKLSTASGMEKQELCGLIQRALWTSASNNGAKSNAGSFQKNFLFLKKSSVPSSMVKRTRWILLEFQKHCQDQEQEVEARSSSRKPSFAFDKPSVRNAESLHQEITLENLQKVWSAFEMFFQAQQTKIKEPTPPVAIDLIIREILQYLPRKDLLKCRKINKAWNRNAMQLHNRNPNYFCSIKDVKKFCTDFETDLPVANIFKRIVVSLETCSIEDCVTFFKKIGPHVKELRIKEEMHRADSRDLQCTVFDYQLKLRTALQCIPEVESLALIYLPKSVVSQPFVFNGDDLKTRVLTKVKDFEFWLYSPHCIPEFRDGLLSMVPNVSEYRFTDNPADRFAESVSLTAASSKFNMQKLSWLALPVLGRHLISGRMKDQKLKTLEAMVGIRDEEDVRGLKALFMSQSETLEILQLSFYSLERVPHPFPVMKRLTYISLTKLETRNMSSPFTFLPLSPECTPSVKRLNLNTLDLLVDIFQAVFPSVEELTIGSGPLENLEALKQIAKVFPNLTKLVAVGLVISEAALVVVFSIPKLEELMLTIFEKGIPKDLTYTLSGIPVESAWIVSQLIATKTAPLVSSFERIQPSLHSMKHLRRLSFDFKLDTASRPEPNQAAADPNPAGVDADPNAAVPNPEAFVIDEVCLNFGFLSMPRLEQLKLTGDFKISEDAISELKKYHYSVVIAQNSK